MGVFSSTAVMLVQALGGLYLLAVLLRFLLQLARADFYNPVSQAVVRVTNPLVKGLRGVIPGYRGIDFATLVLALLVEAALTVTLIALSGFDLPSIGRIITWSVVGVLGFIINIYYWAIIASIIMSFMMAFSGMMSPHPALRLVWQLTEPVMAPFRRIIPPLGGLDFSPIFIFIAIRLVQNLLYSTFGITNQIARVVIGI